MNETLQVLETRRSCRNFDKNRMVSKEDIEAIVKAGTFAAPAPRKDNYVYWLE